MVHIAIENASQKVDRFVLLALRDQHVDAAVDLFRCAIHVPDLQESPPNFEQVVITIFVELYEAKEGSLGIIHHTGGQVRAAEDGEQLDIARIPLECFAEDVDCPIGLALLSIYGCDGCESLTAVRVDDDCLKIRVERL